jgi:hypothetical protein
MSHLYGVQNVFEYSAQRPEQNAVMNVGFAANGRVRADGVVARTTSRPVGPWSMSSADEGS